MMKKLMEKFKINHLLFTPYHPQTNGLVERFNRTLCESLAKLSLKNNDWDLYIALTLFAYKTTKHSTTKIEPFFLVYRRSARLPIDSLEKDNLRLKLIKYQKLLISCQLFGIKRNTKYHKLKLSRRINMIRM